jgi:hypothetical protein
LCCHINAKWINPNAHFVAAFVMNVEKTGRTHQKPVKKVSLNGILRLSICHGGVCKNSINITRSMR